MHSGYNNVFLGGNGLVIINEESLDEIEGGKMFLTRELWKTGNKEAIDNFIEMHPPRDDKPSNLGLECLDFIPKMSNRIHHFH